MSDEKKIPAGRDEIMLAILQTVERLNDKLNAKPKDEYLEGTKQMREAIAARPTDPVELVPVVSQITEARFTAKVCQRSNGESLTQDLIGYQYPAWAFKHQLDGGKVPNSYVIQLPDKTMVPAKGESSANPNEHVEEYLLWRWKETYQRDLQFYVGKPLHPSLRSSI